jgi:hypothetical protein
MTTHRTHQAPVVIETSGVEVVEDVTALAPRTSNSSATAERRLVPFAETLPRIGLKPSPFSESA